MTPWTVAHQAPLSMSFSRQGYWSGLPFPSPWDLPNPGIKPRSPELQADSLLTELQGKPTKNQRTLHSLIIIIELKQTTIHLMVRSDQCQVKKKKMEGEIANHYHAYISLPQPTLLMKSFTFEIAYIFYWRRK